MDAARFIVQEEQIERLQDKLKELENRILELEKKLASKVDKETMHW